MIQKFFKLIFSLSVLSSCSMTLTLNHTFMEGRDTLCVYVTDTIKNVLMELRNEQTIAQNPVLLGLCASLDSGYQFFPFRLASDACVAALELTSSQIHKDILQQYLGALQNDSSLYIDDITKHPCKNKILDCLVINNNAYVNSLCVRGVICGTVTNCDPVASGTGLTGATGLTGNAGQALDAIGETGTTGATGANGLTGFTGSDGAFGQLGAIGEQGVTGNTGIPGLTGNTGSLGNRGLQGTTGNTGTSLITEAYGYIPDTSGTSRLVVPYGGVIASNVSTTVLNVSQVGNAVRVALTGVYEINFEVLGSSYIFTTDTELNSAVQIGLYRNGIPLDGGQYGVGNISESPILRRQVNGQIIVQLNAGDLITLVNHSSYLTTNPSIFLSILGIDPGPGLPIRINNTNFTIRKIA